MPLNLDNYPSFKSDIQGRDTALVPIIKIGDIYISTNSMVYGGEAILPLLTSMPSLKESIDIEKRNYKISSISITINNYTYEGQRFSERVEGSLINTPVQIYWTSPSTATFEDADDSAFKIFNGKIRRYDHDDEKVRLVVEDKSQATLHKDLPLEKNYLETDDSVPDKYKGKPIPMVYGHVKRSPLVISENYRKFQADSQDVDLDNEVYSGYTNASDNEDGIYLDPLQIDIDGEFYHIVRGNQYEYLDNSIGLLSEALSGIVVGTEDVPDSFEEVSLTCRKIATPKFSISNPREDPTWINDNFLVGYSIDSINAITDGSLDTNNIELLGQRNREFIGYESPATFSNSESLLLSINMDVTPQHDTVDGNNKIIGFKINNVNLPKFLGDKVLKANHHNGLDGSSGDATSVSSTYDDNYNLIWDNDCLHSDVINNVFGFLTYGIGGDLVPPNGYDDTASQADIQLNFYDLGSPSTNGLDMPIILFSGALVDGGVNNTFSIQFRAVGNHAVPVGDSYSYMRLDLTGHIDEIGLLVENKAIKVFDKDFYANVKGREMDGDTSPTAPSAIKHILNTELGQNVTVDGDGYSDWQYAFTVDKKINSKKLIENIASASPFIPRFNNMGEFKFDTIPPVLDSGNFIRIYNSDCIDFSFSRSKIESVFSKIILKFNWDYARGEFNDSVESDVSILGYEDDGFTLKYKHDYYGLPDDDSESTLTIDSEQGKYIRNPLTAQKFADWYLLWSCNQHLKIKVKLPLKYMNLEIGDFVHFGDLTASGFIGELLGGVSPYGIDYRSNSNLNSQAIFKQFLITKTNKTLDWVEISCIQMHNQDIEYPDIVYGCTEPDACNYDSTATSNSGCDYGVTCGDGEIVCDASECEPTPNCPSGTFDCLGDCDGSAIIDDCGVCDGIAGYVAGSCYDCAGDPYGGADFDSCGVCGGDETTCTGCLDTDASNFFTIDPQGFQPNEPCCIVQHPDATPDEDVPVYVTIAHPILDGLSPQEIRDNYLPNLISIATVDGGAMVIDDSLFVGTLLEVIGGNQYVVTFSQPTITNLFFVPTEYEIEWDENIDWYYIIFNQQYIGCEGLGYPENELNSCCQYGFCYHRLDSITLDSDFHYIQRLYRPTIDQCSPFPQLGHTILFENIANGYNTYNVDTLELITFTNIEWETTRVEFWVSSNDEDVEILQEEAIEATIVGTTITFGNYDSPLGDLFRFPETPEGEATRAYNVKFTFKIYHTDEGIGVYSDQHQSYFYYETQSINFIQGRFCITGDMNDDGDWNVMDIVTLANCVIAQNCTANDTWACAGDTNGDGGHNILDVVALLNCVLSENCGG